MLTMQKNLNPRFDTQSAAQSFENGSKAMLDGATAGAAGTHLDAAFFYNQAVTAFMRARSEALAYVADGFQHYHLGAHAAQNGQHKDMIAHFDDAEIYFERSRHPHAPLWTYRCKNKAAHGRRIEALHASAFASYASAETALNEGKWPEATSNFLASDKTWAELATLSDIPVNVARGIQGWMHFVRASADYTSGLSAGKGGDNAAALGLFNTSRERLGEAACAAAASPTYLELIGHIQVRMDEVDSAISCARMAVASGAPTTNQRRATIQSSAPLVPPVANPLTSPFRIANTQPPRPDVHMNGCLRDRLPAPSPKAM